MSRRHRISWCCVVVLAAAGLTAAGAGESKWVSIGGGDGKLVYTPDARGNRIPDYSYAGYMGGGVPLPEVPVKATLRPGNGDQSSRIQAVIDAVSKMPADARGIRGAVLLEKGEYQLDQPIKIRAGGVVLRGEGSGESDGTVLRATMHKKCTLISVGGEVSDRKEEKGTRKQIVDERVPVGAKTITVESIGAFKVGDQVIVVRNTNDKWVHEVGMDEIPGRPGAEERTKMWKAGPREAYDRTIAAINPSTGSGQAKITLDVPLYNDITREFGGGYVYRYTFDSRIAQCGVENLRAVSIWTKKPGEGLADEKGTKTADDLKHADHFIVIDNARDCWVRDCYSVDFLQGSYWVERNARNVTIQDCGAVVPDPKLNYYIDEPHGETSRYTFCLLGQGNLVLRGWGRFGRHTFMTQSMVAGPNVFLDCNAEQQHSISETHHRWATGVLFDCIGQKSPTSLESVNRAWMGSGHGWSGAYVTMWNCVGNPIICEIPPTASNWAVGCAGERTHGPFNKQIVEEAYDSWGKHVEPMSLYRAQLRERLGEAAVKVTEPALSLSAAHATKR